MFDFDGTSIDGNSPVLLVSHLMKHDMLRKRDVFRILLWAAAYKLRLPQNEAAVRGLVFSAFEGKPVEEVNAFLAEFYDERIAPLFRTQADAAMRAHAEAGETVLIVSATFEPIILRAMEHHPFERQISTRMCVRPTAPTRVRWKACARRHLHASGGRRAGGGRREARRGAPLRRRAVRPRELGACLRLRRPPLRPRHPRGGRAP
ncbi:HAD family hydrolase, partial [Eggerthella sinensis]|uniref:HAD family hydrolase n=1 Tax=Eggerthella sinensis TaxID=242230 RepID=UPI0022E233CB